MEIEKTAWMLIFTLRNIDGKVVTGVQKSGVVGCDEKIEFTLHMAYSVDYIDFSGTIDEMPEMVQRINDKYMKKSKVQWAVVTRHINIDVSDCL